MRSDALLDSLLKGGKGGFNEQGIVYRLLLRFGHKMMASFLAC